MKTYRAEFEGRKSGAIGITYHITDTVKGETPGAAMLALYDNYEHISFLKLYEIGAQFENGVSNINAYQGY